MRGERPNETFARRIVADVLGVPVEQHDDNSRQSMVDAMIHATGAQIPLEVVMDVAPAVMKQAAELGRYSAGIPLPEGSGTWLVQIARGSRTSRLGTTLPPLIAALDPSGVFEEVPSALAELGVMSISPTGTDGSPTILLVGQGVSYGGAGPDLNGYVERFLERTPDVSYKLTLAAGPERAHVFIWLTISGDYDGWAAFRDEDWPLPSTGPNLPLGVTDVWLAMTNLGYRVIRYSPENGWERTGRVISLDDEKMLHPDGS